MCVLLIQFFCVFFCSGKYNVFFSGKVGVVDGARLSHHGIEFFVLFFKIIIKEATIYEVVCWCVRIDGDEA